MTSPVTGARPRAGAGVLQPAQVASSPAGAGGSLIAPRPISSVAFLGVAVASFGGPLALAALIAPAVAADAAGSAGLASVAALVVFAAPLVIWLRFSGQIADSGGLTAFVAAAAGRRVALVQAAIWTVSYLLYIVYTTVQIVYDVLPAVVPGERVHQTVLALAIPVAIAGVMVVGRGAALAIVGLLAAGQLALAGILDGVTLAHLSVTAGTFGVGAGGGAVAKAGADSSLLYICGSLPLFLGGELATTGRTMRRGLLAAYALTGLVVVLAVAPLAAAPGLTRTTIPGLSVMTEFAGSGWARAVGLGVAASIAGVIMCEYLAVGRLLSAVGHWRPRAVNLSIAAVLVLSAPLSLIDPNGFYDTLLTPSLAALWLSQLVVFAVYPRFARARGYRMVPAWGLSLVASGLAGYGLWTVIIQPAS